MTKILIFENDHAFAVELRGELTRLGCAVQVFQEGNPGLIAASSNPPDLILLSVELPRINGFSICNKIKKDARLKTVPLIILSSHSSHETFEQHQRLPTRAEDYVHKPIAFVELLPRMQRLVPIGLPGPGVDRLLATDENEDFETMQVSATDISQAMAARGVQLPAFEVGADFDGPGDARPAPGVVASQGVYARPSTGQPPPSFRPDQTGPQQPSPFMPEYALGDDEDDEVERTRVAIDDLERHQAMAQAAPTAGAGGWPSAAPEGDQHLRADLISTKRALQAALLQLSQLKRSVGDPQELGRLRAMATDAERLRRELDHARTELANRSSVSAVSERETLDLREKLNSRDRELLDLREQLSTRDRELIESRDGALVTERELADRKAELGQLRAQLDESTAHVEALLADKALADKRAADFKAGAKKIADQLNQRAKELRDLQAQHEEALAQQEQRAQLALKELEEKLRSQLREAEQTHQTQIARLKKEHDEALGRASQGAASARTEVEQRAMAELEALKTELEALKTELATAQGDAQQLREQVAERDQTLAAEKQAAEKARVQLAQEHEQALARAEAAGGEKAQASEAERREALDALRTELEAEHAEQLDAAERQHQDELAELTRQSDETVERELAAERDRYETAQAALQQRIDELQASLTAAEEETTRLGGVTDELGALTSELDSMRSDRDALATQVEELQSGLTSIEDAMGTLKEELVSAKSERDELSLQCSDLGDKNTRLDEELAAARADVDDLHRRAKAERAARDRAREALAAVVSQLDVEQDEPAGD